MNLEIQRKPGLRPAYQPDEAEPFWPKHMWQHLWATLIVLAVVLLLARFGVRALDPNEQPVSTSPWPQPDWLFLMLFQPTRFLRGLPDWVGLGLVPLLVLAAMVAVPLLDKGRSRAAAGKSRLGVARRWATGVAALFLVLGLAVFTGRSGSTTPMWGCQACHKPGFGSTFGKAPEAVADFTLGLDNAWLSIHYQYPQYWWMMDTLPPRW